MRGWDSEARDFVAGSSSPAAPSRSSQTVFTDCTSQNAVGKIISPVEILLSDEKMREYQLWRHLLPPG
jgi:hypothetical protein